jgi:hypothetical protein
VHQPIVVVQSWEFTGHSWLFESVSANFPIPANDTFYLFSMATDAYIIRPLTMLASEHFQFDGSSADNLEVRGAHSRWGETPFFLCFDLLPCCILVADSYNNKSMI